MEGERIAIGDVAERYRIRVRTVYREIERGRLRAYRLAGRVYTTEAAIADWLREAGTAEPQPHRPRTVDKLVNEFAAWRQRSAA